MDQFTTFGSAEAAVPESQAAPAAIAASSPRGWSARGLRRALAAYLVVGGSVSLLGWVLNVQRLADWDFNGIAIQPNTCLCVVLGGLALWSLTTLSARSFAFSCGAAIAAIAGLTLLEWISGVRLGVDELLLFGREWGRVGASVPGRMAPAGSASWLLVGGSIMLSARGTAARRWAPRLALATFALAFLSIVGYVYDVSVLYSVEHLTLVALQTCTFLLAVSAGVVVGIPEHEPMRTLLDPGAAGILARRGLPFLVILPIAVGYLHVRISRGGSPEAGMATAMLVLVLTGVLVVTQWWLLEAVRRHEQLFRGSDARTSLAAQATGLIGWEWDPRRDRITTNGAVRDVYGVEELSDSRSVIDLILPEDREVHLQHFWGVASEGGEYVSQFRIRRADNGRIVWLEERARALLNPEGGVEGVVGITVDVTQWRRAEELLLRAR